MANTTNTTTKREQFWQQIKSQMTAQEFEDLRVACGMKSYKWTAVQRNTKDFNLEELTKLSNKLDVPLIDLIQKYGLGIRSLTGKQLTDIATAAGRTLRFV